MNRMNKRIHKIEFTENELYRLNLAIRYYSNEAEKQDNYQMLLDKEILTRLTKIFTARLFDLQFKPGKTATVAIRQIEIDLIWRVMQHMHELRDVLMKIGSKTHSYAA
jgi:hypothetical protein